MANRLSAKKANNFSSRDIGNTGFSRLSLNLITVTKIYCKNMTANVEFLIRKGISHPTFYGNITYKAYKFKK